MNACGSQQRWKESLQALRRMQDGHMQPNLTTFNAIINARERGRIWKDAVQVVAKLVEQRVVPGILTGCAAVAAAGRSTKWQLVLAFLPRFQADLVLHSSAMDACLSAQRCQPVFVLLQELCDGSVKADAVIYNSVMAACVIARQPKAAAAIWLQWVQSGLHSSSCAVSRPGINGIRELRQSAELHMIQETIQNCTM